MRSRAASLLGTLLFLVVAPGTVAVLVPYWITRWRVGPPLLGFGGLPVLGGLLILLGAPVLLESFGRFALEGRGTPAPIAPPERLVVHGFYRFVRNPMYVAVLLVVAGEGLLFGSVAVLQFALIAFVCVHLFVLLYEEPTLRGKFGAEYETYRSHVRRWLPRLSPWKPGA